MFPSQEDILRRRVASSTCSEYHLSAHGLPAMLALSTSYPFLDPVGRGRLFPRAIRPLPGFEPPGLSLRVTLVAFITNCPLH